MRHTGIAGSWRWFSRWLFTVSSRAWLSAGRSCRPPRRTRRAEPLGRLSALRLGRVPPHLLAERFLARSLLRREHVSREIRRPEHLAHLDLAILERRARRPVDRLRLRLHLDHPVAGDQLLRLRER